VTDADGRVLDEYIKQFRPGHDSVRRNLVLQHYGAPTPYIDVTRDIKVAEWFALNKLRIDSKGMTAIGTVHAPFRESAIFVFLVLDDLVPMVETEDLVDPSESLRPYRQHCAVLGGAGNLYRNATSRFVGVKIKFGDAFLPAGLPTATWLFPGPDEDNALKQLLSQYQASVHETNIFPPYWLRGG